MRCEVHAKRKNMKLSQKRNTKQTSPYSRAHWRFNSFKDTQESCWSLVLKVTSFSFLADNEGRTSISRITKYCPNIIKYQVWRRITRNSLTNDLVDASRNLWDSNFHRSKQDRKVGCKIRASSDEIWALSQIDSTNWVGNVLRWVGDIPLQTRAHKNTIRKRKEKHD